MADKSGKYHRPKEHKKVRVDIRRNKQTRARQQNLTNELMNDQETAADTDSSERVRAKSDISRRRTVVGIESDGEQLVRAVNSDLCQPGRVVSFIGLNCLVQSEDGREYECTIRGVLRSLARGSRNVVITGDRVQFHLQGDSHQGVIERVEPRHGVLSRGSQGREHILVANIDQVLIVASAAESERPRLKSWLMRWGLSMVIVGPAVAALVLLLL